MEAWIKGIRRAGEEEGRVGRSTWGPRGLHWWHAVASVGHGQGRVPSWQPGVVFEEADGFCGGLGVPEDSSTTRCLPCSHAWGGPSPKDSIKVKAPTGSQPVLWLRAEVGSRLYQDGVCVSSPEHGLATNPFCKFQDTEPRGLPLVLCHSFLLATSHATSLQVLLLGHSSSHCL